MAGSCNFKGLLVSYDWVNVEMELGSGQVERHGMVGLGRGWVARPVHSSPQRSKGCVWVCVCGVFSCNTPD